MARSRTVLAAAAAALAAATASTRTPVSITLDGTTALHTYEGHGALSAGASSRLLWDYPSPQREQVLDYLFKPQFGAGLHTLKVEIGGDSQSTDGTEPSHKHTRSDLSCTRGYELWLIQQAKARNPAIQTYGLSWGIPAWVGNGTYYSDENVAYQTSWMSCIEQASGFKLDYMGLWNEKPQPDADYVLQLRAAMDAAGFDNTKIIVMDGGFDADEVATAQSNATYAAAIHGAGLHYPCDNPQKSVRETGWTFWASEDYSRDPAWSNGGTYWGKVLSQNYVVMNMTATISWSLIWSAYTNLVCNGAGLMRAHEPWTGNYEASAPIWASAHWTQFVQPGWRFLHVPGGGSGFLMAPTGVSAGTYVTLVPPNDLSGLTVILETLANDDCIQRNYTDFSVTFKTGGGLPGPGTVLHVWKTTSTAYFVQQPDITIAGDGTFTVTMDADSMVTVSTTAGATHGSFPSSPIPASAPWPLPYSDNFNSYSYDAMAKYFSDQGGSWAARNGSLVQLTPADPGSNGWAANPDPLTQIGDPNWADYSVTADVTFSSGPPVGAEGEDLTVVLPSGKALAGGSSKRRSSGRRRHLQRLNQWRKGKGLPPVPEDDVQQLGGTPMMTPCDPTDTAQKWLWDAPSPGYLQSLSNGYATDQCLNIAGCEPDQVILYQCVNDPNGSSCGAPAGQYPNLVWSLNASGALVTPEPQSPGWALTMYEGNRSLYASPAFTGAPNQVWAWNASSGQLSLPGLGLCLSNGPPKRTYAQVCLRITSFDGFNAQAAMDGYCLQLDVKGGWAVVSAGMTLAQGNVTSWSADGAASPLSFDPTQPHTLSISASGPVINGWINGVQVAALTDKGFSYGNAALGSGWHAASFDNFKVDVPMMAGA